MALGGEPIRSRANPLVRRLRAARDRAGGAEPAFVEGVKLVEEALAAGAHIEEVAASRRLERHDRGLRLLAALAERGIPVRHLDHGVLESLSDVEASQGVLALARRPRFSEEDFYRGEPLLLLAGGVQDPGNLGALLRVAEGAGATGAYLTRGSADPFSWKALRGSMGSAFRLPHVRSLTLEAAFDSLARHGVRVAAAVAAGGERPDRVDLSRGVALALGSEGSGLPDWAVARADLKLTIPLRGRVESLNVAVAAGVLFFETARQRNEARAVTSVTPTFPPSPTVRRGS
jgi:TrmH family RNA methyltransferase